MTTRRMLSIAGAIVGLAVAGFVVRRDDAAVDALTAVSAVMLVVILVAQIINLAADSMRYWMVLPARFREPLPRWRWHHIFAVGRLLNLVVPQAGAAYRAARLKLAHGVPVATFFGSVAVITWLGNGVALLAAAVAVLAAGAVVPAALIGAAGVAVLLGIWALPRLPWFRPGRSPRWLSERAVSIVTNFSEAFRDLGQGRLRPVLGVSIISQLAGLAAYVLVVDALGAPNPIVVGSVIYAGTTIATVVSLTPGGLGITELAAGVAGVAVDFGAGSAVLAAFVIRVTGVVSVGGLALLAGLLDSGKPAPPTAVG